MSINESPNGSQTGDTKSVTARGKTTKRREFEGKKRRKLKCTENRDSANHRTKEIFFFKSISNLFKMGLQKNCTAKSPSLHGQECRHNICRVHCITFPEKTAWNFALQTQYYFQLYQALKISHTGMKMNDKVKNIQPYQTKYFYA